jgi:hypothetical protein
LKRFGVMRWAAWAPGIETEQQWKAWARAPRELAEEGAPEIRFLPALQRRRCDQLSRMMLEVAHQCCETPRLREVASVFASRHGAICTTVSLLEDLAADSVISPTRFSHSVHNTQSGLFSIWARNPRPSASVAACAETFAHGFLEAICMLHREGGRPVLFVAGDEAIPPPLSGISDHRGGAYAVAFLLGGSGLGTALEFRLEAARCEEARQERPDALEFVRWWISKEKSLRLARGRRAWVWTRVV